MKAGNERSELSGKTAGNELSGKRSDELSGQRDPAATQHTDAHIEASDANTAATPESTPPHASHRHGESLPLYGLDTDEAAKTPPRARTLRTQGDTRSADKHIAAPTGLDWSAQVWPKMLSHLRQHHAQLCRRWFEEELEPSEPLNGRLPLRATSVAHCDYLQSFCYDQFNEAVQAVTGTLLTVRFLGPDEPAEVRTPEHQPTAKVDQRGLVVNPDNGFETFVVGPSNRLAHAASVAVASNPGKAYNPLFIHGDVGLGKTHLLQAICLNILKDNPSARLLYLSCEDFMTEFMTAVRGGEMSAFRHRFRDLDVLVVDEIHYLGKRDRSQEEFFHTFNALYQASKQIVLSSDAPPERIPALENRLVSRFKWGLVTTVEPPGFETRVHILKTKARIRGFDLPDEAACAIANRIDSNIRELEGAVGKIQLHLSVRGDVPINEELVEIALGPVPGKRQSTVSVQQIINVVTDHFGVRLSDLQSKKRHRSIAQPRQMCMYFARKLTRHSLEEIGGYFGGRDHTTVMHACKVVEERSEGDADALKTIETLERKIKDARAT
ncbi:MAG: chromosomal replication initiator protein DnaA [Planctomycetota bacterium]